jgi:5-methylcytosine-specific restriction endonuclease McrA
MGHRHTIEWKRQHSLAMIGTNNPMFGKHRTDKEKRAISIANKGHYVSDEQRGYFSKMFSGVNNPNYGRHHTPRAKKRISDTHKGMRFSEDVIRQRAASCRRLFDLRGRKSYPRELRKDWRYVNWRKAVIRKTDGKCYVCGERKPRMVAHHITSFKYDSLHNYDVNYGVPLCRDCHKIIHT